MYITKLSTERAQNIMQREGQSMESIMFRIMNLKELHKLEDEIEQIGDVQERETRTMLVEQILESITNYDIHVREFAYQQSVQMLIDRGIIFEAVDRDPVVTQWDRQFDSLVSADAKRSARHYTNQFRWHLFSFELLPAIQGDEARTAFDQVKKQELYLFYDYANEAYRIKNAHLLTSGDVERLRENSSLNHSDMYFFDPINNWLYVKPHEEYCGPYFFQAK